MDNVTAIMFFSGVILANFYCAAILIVLRRRSKGNNNPSRGGKRPATKRFKLPPFLMFDLKSFFRRYYWLRPCYTAIVYSTAVPVGEMRSFELKQLGARTERTSGYVH